MKVVHELNMMTSIATESARGTGVESGEEIGAQKRTETAIEARTEAGNEKAIETEIVAANEEETAAGIAIDDHLLMIGKNHETVTEIHTKVDVTEEAVQPTNTAIVLDQNTKETTDMRKLPLLACHLQSSLGKFMVLFTVSIFD